MSSIPPSSKEGHTPKAARKWIVNIVRTLTALWLIVHFTLTVLYVFPISPAKDTLQPLIDATIGTYFPQNWMLFAPGPISVDLELLVRPLNDNEYSATLTKGLPSDGWYNILPPLWTKDQQNRFSAYEKLSRTGLLAIRSHLTDPNDDQSVQIMIGLASAFCKDIGKSNDDYVALMIQEVLPKSWSDRGKTVPRVVKSIPVGVYPMDTGVENAHLYQM